MKPLAYFQLFMAVFNTFFATWLGWDYVSVFLVVFSMVVYVIVAGIDTLLYARDKWRKERCDHHPIKRKLLDEYFGV